jgi:hypothetical protein
MTVQGDGSLWCDRCEIPPRVANELDQQSREEAADHAMLVGSGPVTKQTLRDRRFIYNGQGQWRLNTDGVEVTAVFADDGGPPGILVRPFEAPDSVCIIPNCTVRQLDHLLEALD